MSIPGSTNPLLLFGDPTGGQYQVSRSLRFNSSDSAILSRTPGTASNRKTWTWAGWVKRGALGTNQGLFSSVNAATQQRFEFISDKLYWIWAQGTVALNTDAVFRDASAWYHIVLASDTDNATAANRIKIYVNGVAQTLSGTAVSPGEQWDINTTIQHRIGNFNDGVSNYNYFNGYLADIHFIDGQALTPSSFTEVSATTGQLIPKAYSGSFGTNGFWLKFSDNSAATAAALGNDYSGNNNDWTPNNLSVTAGAGNDSLVDTPTSYGTPDTGVGGEVRGNYATLNPLYTYNGTTLRNGNLDFLYGSGQSSASATMSAYSGKYYCEMTPTTINTMVHFGVFALGGNSNGANIGPGQTSRVIYLSSGAVETNTQVATYATYTTSDVIGIALNLDASPPTVAFYKNGSLQGTINLSTSFYNWTFAVLLNGGGDAGSANFGQRAFVYTAPSGFKALCDTNLPSPLIAKPNTVFDVVTRTFTGASASITSLAFAPDFLWFKRRNDAASHSLFDSVRGVSKRLLSNGTNDEITVTDALTSFDSSGFTLGVDSGSISVNGPSSGTGVVWAWDAGTSTVSNTQGSITSQVRANVSAGFSVITWTGNGSAGATIGHSLGIAPRFVIFKTRSISENWNCYHGSLGASQLIALNSTNAASATNDFNNTAPSSTLITLGSGTGNNGNGTTYVAYCFSPVVGYSSFGSYTGNGSSDGPFVYTGFRPRWVMVKCSSASGFRWIVWDSARDPYNLTTTSLAPNLSDSEITGFDIDIVSNGFKLRDSENTLNQSGSTYIYAAFAENPFQYARAR